MSRTDRVQLVVLVIVVVWLIAWSLAPMSRSALDNPGPRRVGR